MTSANDTVNKQAVASAFSRAAGSYDAAAALDMGLGNTVVPLADLEKETVRWCREMLQNSPMALRCLKAAQNAD